MWDSEVPIAIPVIPIRYYVFKPLTAFLNSQPDALNPPFGDNLVAVLYTNEALRQRAGAIIRQAGFRLQLKPADNELAHCQGCEGRALQLSVDQRLGDAAPGRVFAGSAGNQSTTPRCCWMSPNRTPSRSTRSYFAERIALDPSATSSSSRHIIRMCCPPLWKRHQMAELNVFVTNHGGLRDEAQAGAGPEVCRSCLEFDSDAFFNLGKLVDRMRLFLECKPG